MLAALVALAGGSLPAEGAITLAQAIGTSSTAAAGTSITVTVPASGVAAGDTVVLASDGRCENKPKFEGFALTVSAKSESEADTVFAALGGGGQVTMPLAKTFFAQRFGMLSDKFGVHWMVIVPPQA